MPTDTPLVIPPNLKDHGVPTGVVGFEQPPTSTPTFDTLEKFLQSGSEKMVRARKCRERITTLHGEMQGHLRDLTEASKVAKETSKILREVIPYFLQPYIQLMFSQFSVALASTDSEPED